MINIEAIYIKGGKILIVGPYPPQLGGISVFIYRLHKLMLNQGYQVTVFNTALSYRFFGMKFLAFIMLVVKQKHTVIHIHNFDFKRVIILFLLRPIKKYKIYFTDHNPFLFDNRNLLTTSFIRFYLFKLDKLIVVNDHVLSNYRAHKAKLPKDCIIENAFLPPPVEDKEKILNSYPLELFTFLTNHSPIIIANAYQLKKVDGVDLYGLDMCLELVRKLNQDYSNVGLVFCIADEKTNSQMLTDAVKFINDTGISRNVFFLTGQKEIWPLYEKAHLFVRPTYRDGYGISIDEALHFNCPAIASDVCKRNPNTLIFKNRNISELYAQCNLIFKTNNNGFR